MENNDLFVANSNTQFFSDLSDWIDTLLFSIDSSGVTLTLLVELSAFSIIRNLNFFFVF